VKSAESTRLSKPAIAVNGGLNSKGEPEVAGCAIGRGSRNCPRWE